MSRDCIRRGNRIGGPERREAGLSIGIQIQIEMADRGNALLGALPAVRTKRIGSHIDVRAGRVLVREPTEVTGRERSLQLDDSLSCRGGHLTP